MPAPNYARVSEGLKLFRDSILGFVVAELKRAYGELNWWEQGVARHFKKEDLDNLKELFEKRGQKLTVLPIRAAELHEMLDVNHVRPIVEGNWKDVFEATLKDRKVLVWLQEVVDARNVWAHPPSGDVKAADANRLLDTCARITALFDEATSRRLEELRDAKIAAPLAPGALPHWWQVARPHRDFREGRFDESLFAADIGYVVQGQGAREYVDPDTFFDRTFPTRGLRELLKNVLERVRGGPGDPVVQVQTPFGGGKTHVLVALYHLFNSPEQARRADWVQELLKELGLDDVPKVKLVVVDGARLGTGPAEKPDGATVSTVWGEMAWQVGGGRLFMRTMADADSSRTAPGKDAIDQVLQAAGPTLLLLDEIPQFLEKADGVTVGRRTLADQVIAFLQELAVTVANHPHAAMVFTLTRSEGREGARVAQLTRSFDEMRREELQGRLEHRMHRVESVWQPLEGEEIFEVVRRRLFEDLGDPAVHAQVAQAYWDAFDKHSDSLPGEARGLEYKRLLEKSYPLHPELVKVLYEKWSALPDFQRTRGVLRLLAMVVSDCWKRQVPVPLIHPSHVNLGDPQIRPEVVTLLKQGNFEPVIASDIAGPSAKAAELDRGADPVLGGTGPAVGVATTVFVHSFGGGERKGATEPYIQWATLLPGLSPAIVGSTLPKLSRRLWFIHQEGDFYRFDSIPNLVRIIDEREEALRADREGKVDQLLESVLTEAVGRGLFRPYIWTREHRDVDDSPLLSLVVLKDTTAAAGGLEWEARSQGVVDEWSKRHGNTPRKYQNAVVFLLADEAEREHMRAAARRLLACDAVSKDRSIKLVDAQKADLEDMLKEAKQALPASAASCYRHVAYPTKDGLKLVDFGARAYTGPGVLQERVREKLEEVGIEKLVNRVDPQLLVTNRLEVWPDRDSPLNLKQLAEWFPQYPYLPMLASEDGLRETVAKGVRDGGLALAYGEPPDFDPVNVKYRRPALSAMEVEITESAWLLRPHLAEKYAVHEAPPGEEGEREPEKELAGEREGSPTGVVEAEHGYREVQIEIDGWENWNDVLRYVIRPLSDQGIVPEVHITIKASSAKGIPVKLMREQIEVSLQQLGIKYTLRTSQDEGREPGGPS
jgi:hypothetical protein